MRDHNEHPDDSDRRRRREQRRELARQLVEKAAGPPAFRVTLAQARARWADWEAAHNERRLETRWAAWDKFGPVLGSLLLDVHLPELPPPDDVVAYALELECGHEQFWLVNAADAPGPPPERAPCPIFWSCQLNEGRTATRYVKPGEAEPAHTGHGLTRWAVALACGHDSEVLLAQDKASRVGDFMVCRACEQETPDADVEIVALGARLPDQVVEHWTVELHCGHRGTDHFIPIEHRDDPAAYRTENPHRNGLRCINRACDQRNVGDVRRLGRIGKIRAPKPTPAPRDLVAVAVAVRDLKRRLTKQQRQALIRELQQDT